MEIVAYRMPELLGAVESPTHYAVSVSTEGMAPQEASRGEMRIGKDLCQGPSVRLHLCDVNDLAFIRDLASVTELSHHTPGL